MGLLTVEIDVTDQDAVMNSPEPDQLLRRGLYQRPMDA